MPRTDVSRGSLTDLIRGHSRALPPPNRPFIECENVGVTLSAWLRVGWLVLAADVVYWLWMMGHTDEPGPHGWWGTLNIFLYFGGALLFVVLVVVSLLVWHANERAGRLS